MSIALAGPEQAVTGEEIVITGTGFTSAGSVKMTVKNAEESMSVEVTLTASGGAITTANHCKVIPHAPGNYTFHFNDVTAVATKEITVEVFESS